jgi:hypothetical protein
MMLATMAEREQPRTLSGCKGTKYSVNIKEQFKKVVT